MTPHPLLRTLRRHQIVVEQTLGRKPACPITVAEYEEEIEHLARCIARDATDDATGATHPIMLTVDGPMPRGESV